MVDLYRIPQNVWMKSKGVFGMEHVADAYYGTCSAWTEALHFMTEVVERKDGYPQYVKVNRPYTPDQLVQVGPETFITKDYVTFADMIEYSDFTTPYCLYETAEAFSEEKREQTRKELIRRGVDEETMRYFNHILTVADEGLYG